MFLTLTCDSYGKVDPDGMPADPDRYDYRGRPATRCTSPRCSTGSSRTCAASRVRRAVLRRGRAAAAAGPARPRGDPRHRVPHRAAAGPRRDLPPGLVATRRHVRHDDAHLPVWHEPSGRYLDPATGRFLPAWDEALDAIGPDDEPLHVARFGPKFDAQGVLAGSRDSARCIGYLTKYLTKHVADCHQATTDAQHAHAERLADALRYEPCSPTCANWLRYGVQPRNPREGLRPGRCPGRPTAASTSATRAAGPGLPQVVRQDPCRPPRRPQSLAPGTLGLSATDPARYAWEPVTPGDPDHMPPAQRLLHVVADRQRWHAALTWPEQEPAARPAQIFRQPGGPHDGRAEPLTAPDRRPGRRAARHHRAFPRRLIEQRRIRFVRVGRHVRIPESAPPRVHRGRAGRAHHPAQLPGRKIA